MGFIRIFWLVLLSVQPRFVTGEDHRINPSNENDENSIFGEPKVKVELSKSRIDDVLYREVLKTAERTGNKDKMNLNMDTSKLSINDFLPKENVKKLENLYTGKSLETAATPSVIDNFFELSFGTKPNPEQRKIAAEQFEEGRREVLEMERVPISKPKSDENIDNLKSNNKPAEALSTLGSGQSDVTTAMGKQLRNIADVAAARIVVPLIGIRMVTDSLALWKEREISAQLPTPDIKPVLIREDPTTANRRNIDVPSKCTAPTKFG